MTKIQTNWNLGLLYKNENDPQIEKDLQIIEKAYSAFEKKYRNKDFTSTPQKLLRALEERENLRKDLSHTCPNWYFNLKFDLNSTDNIAQANMTKFAQRIISAKNKIKFFGISIAKIPKAEQKSFLKNPVLKDYKYSLVKIFNNSKHRLIEEEEQIISLLSQPGYSMWTKGQSKVLSQKTLEHKGKEITLTEAQSILSDLPKKERKTLYKKVMEAIISNSDFAEAEINAIYNYKKIIDERRGYKKEYSDTILDHEMDEETVENLVSLVSKNFKISHKFYKLHSKLLKEKVLGMEDRGVSIGKIGKKFDFETAVELVRGAFEKVDPIFADTLTSFVQNGQIDVYPKKGKRGGAYSWGGGKDLPTFILLNHTDDIRSVETLAHEMGHSIHTEFSKKQPYRYASYTTATAEVASTFFEQLTVSELEKNLTPKEQVIFLHNKILVDITTVFRQIACFNFESELHREIRKRGQVPKEDIAKLMKKHLKSYVGDSVMVTDEDGYFFISWPHIRNFFYVYTYAYGQLISRALFEKWQRDPSYAKKIEQFLSAGGSMSPKDIFKSIGIDTSNPEFFKLGLKGIEKDIDRLEKLAKEAKMI